MSVTENTSGRQNPGSEKGNGQNETKAANAKPQRKPEDEKRKIRCAFTGHRPQYLTRCEEDVRVDLENAIMAAIKDGYTTFISGLAYGVDIWAAEIVARMKAHNPALHLVAAIPFPDFSDGWTEEWKARYNVLLAEAEYVKVMAPAYSNEAYHARNRWLVDHSSRVIAVYNGEPSGTRNTILYARKTRVPVQVLKG